MWFQQELYLFIINKKLICQRQVCLLAGLLKDMKVFGTPCPGIKCTNQMQTFRNTFLISSHIIFLIVFDTVTSGICVVLRLHFKLDHSCLRTGKTFVILFKYRSRFCLHPDAQHTNRTHNRDSSSLILSAGTWGSGKFAKSQRRHFCIPVLSCCFCSFKSSCVQNLCRLRQIVVRRGREKSYIGIWSVVFVWLLRALSRLVIAFCVVHWQITLGIIIDLRSVPVETGWLPASVEMAEPVCSTWSSAVSFTELSVACSWHAFTNPWVEGGPHLDSIETTRSSWVNLPVLDLTLLQPDSNVNVILEHNRPNAHTCSVGEEPRHLMFFTFRNCKRLNSCCSSLDTFLFPLPYFLYPEKEVKL